MSFDFSSVGLNVKQKKKRKVGRKATGCARELVDASHGPAELACNGLGCALQCC